MRDEVMANQVNGGSKRNIDFSTLSPTEQTKVNTEADQKFWALHPELNGQFLDATDPNQASLRSEWMGIRSGIVATNSEEILADQNTMPQESPSDQPAQATINSSPQYSPAKIGMPSQDSMDPDSVRKYLALMNSELNTTLNAPNQSSAMSSDLTQPGDNQSNENGNVANQAQLKQAMLQSVQGVTASIKAEEGMGFSLQQALDQMPSSSDPLTAALLSILKNDLLAGESQDQIANDLLNYYNQHQTQGTQPQIFSSNKAPTANSSTGWSPNKQPAGSRNNGQYQNTVSTQPVGVAMPGYGNESSTKGQSSGAYGKGCDGGVPPPNVIAPKYK